MLRNRPATTPFVWRSWRGLVLGAIAGAVIVGGIVSLRGCADPAHPREKTSPVAPPTPQ